MRQSRSFRCGGSRQLYVLASRNQSSPSPAAADGYSMQTLVSVLSHYGEQYCDVIWLSSSYIQSIVTGKLCKR